MLKQGIETECKAMLNDSNLICLFGLSIGETDKIWWEHIGNQLNKNCKIIYFIKEEEDVDERYLGQIERKYTKYLLERMNLNPDEYEKYKDQIFIAHNTEIFDIELN